MLEKLKTYNVELNADKCAYNQKSIEFLGHVIGNGKISPSPNRIAAIKNCALPTNKQALQSFLGLVNYCRKFIPRLSETAKPLFDLIKLTNKNINIGNKIKEPKNKEAFQKIKEVLMEHTCLSLPDLTKEFILTTDASGIGIGAILSQLQNNEEKIIAFYSKLHNNAQSRYSTTEQKLLAVVEAIEHFKPYLWGKTFTLRTDHQALLFMFKTRNLKSRMMRWSLILQDYSIKLEYIKGNNNCTDILSRAFECNTVKFMKRGRKLLLPMEGKRENIIKECHLKTGHGGRCPTKYLLFKYFYWRGANTQINKFIDNCEICKKSRGPNMQIGLHPIKVEEGNRLWEIDIVGKLPKVNGYQYILTIIDVFTKRGAAMPLKHKTCEETSKALQEILKTWDHPNTILCDNGLEFVGKQIINICKRFNINLIHGSAYCPTTQGAVERFNQTLIGKIKK